MRRPLILLLVVTLGIAGCGYFNSFYNANRRYADALRADARGDLVTARAAYRESIDKAAVSFRSHPDGRWSDDALLLIGRARFALREDADAAAAMRHVLARNTAASHHDVAAAYLGAALVRLDSVNAALPFLDQAVDLLRADTDIAAFARLWRGRAAFRDGRPADGWIDLDLAAAHNHTAVDAALEAANRAVALRDSLRLHDALARLALRRDAQRVVTPVEQLIWDGAMQWDAVTLLAASVPLERAVWPADAVDRIAIVRARIAAEAGQTALAVQIATRVAESTRGGAGSRARHMAARWRLASLSEPQELDDIHALLLPAFDEPQALALLRAVRAAQLLVARGSNAASSLSLFAAGELTRDELTAPLLARRLFLDFAALAPGEPWAGKAVLAAHDAAPDSQTVAWVERLRDNPYIVAAATGVGSEAFVQAEQRLARGLTGLRADAFAEVVLRDVALGRAVGALDSTRAAARADTIRIACGTLIDSLAIRGVRADSTRSACLRGDSARVAFVLEADTTALLTGRNPPAAGTPLLPVQVRPDTIELH
ncbi:hypothetical protein BH23GEM9_BH23GEM9_24940 [soil metagenome]